MLTNDLFTARHDGYYCHRIPGIVTTPAGSLIAYAEARKENAQDWGDIDLRYRRSTDNGDTWSDARKIVTRNDLGETLNNVVFIADHQTNRLVVLFCADYSHVYRLFSEDDGVTFSEPEEITAQLNDFNNDYPFNVIAMGPGHGIQLRNGRLVCPVWISPGPHKKSHRPNRCGTIVSDDGGVSWQAGELVADTYPNSNESTVVELSDGRVMINMRHNDPKQGPQQLDLAYRAISISHDGATGWSEPQLDTNLPDPTCFASLIRVNPTTIAFINCDSHSTTMGAWAMDRANLTVRLSHDDGKTWAASRVLEAKEAGYADITVLPNGDIGCFYECDHLGSMCEIGALRFARFSQDWVVQDQEAVTI